MEMYFLSSSILPKSFFCWYGLVRDRCDRKGLFVIICFRRSVVVSRPDIERILSRNVSLEMASARVLVELRPNKKFLDPDFQGYKLSLDPVPVKQVQLQSPPDQVTPSDSQYSFLHAKIFGLHNKLYKDPWNEESIYFIDDKWKVFTLRHDGPILDEVWEVPSHHERQAGHYNLSLIFASPDLVAIADGAGTLHIAATGDRSLNGKKWEILFSCEPIGREKGFIMMDSRHYCDEIHCLLLHVDEEGPLQSTSNTETKELKSRFKSILNWITLKGEGNNWSMYAVRLLSGNGSVDYAAVEPTCTAIYVASNSQMKFLSDSETPFMPEDSGSKKDEALKLQTIFTWLQTSDDITLWLTLPPDVTKSDIKVTVTSLTLQITVQGNVALEGKLYQNVDAELTSWIIQSEKLEIMLTKEETGLVWPEVLINNTLGEEVLDPSFVEEVHQRLAHLCSDNVEAGESGPSFSYNSQQLEECDDFPGDSAILHRLDCKNHSISHQANLGGHQWLFSTNLQAGAPPAICVRHDVDACIWKIEELNRELNVWPVSHIGSFLAFGYVQASKQQRKFTVCPSDMSYVAICDSMRHVYVYRQPGCTGGELRNRSTGRRVSQIAKQHIVQFESNQLILGCQATRNFVFVLTMDSLYKLSVI